jgi:cytochrome P450
MHPRDHTPSPDPFWFTRNPVGLTRRALRSTTKCRPPGPKGRPFLGVLPEFRADPFEYPKHLHDIYGDVYRMPLPFYDVVFLNRPEHVSRIMTCRDGEYSMMGGLTWLPRLFGAAVPLMEGNAFRQRRKMLMPMFGRRHLSEVADIIVDEFAVRLRNWDRFAASGETVDLQREIARLTLPAFMKAMFSVEITDPEIEQLDFELRALMRALASLFLLTPVPRLLPGRENSVQIMVRMRKWVTTVIDARLAEPAPRPDLLQVMLDARNEDGTPVSRRDLIMEMIILMAGGYETVVASLSWTLALLPRNPTAQQRLYTEVDNLNGERPTFNDLARLEWAKACFDEGQRLQGHPFHPRFAMVDDIIDGYRIPRGTMVGVSMYVLQRDPRWWGPDAENYNPNRFHDKTIAADRPNLAYIPFGAGPHRCVGAAMGYMNAQFLLALIHERFRVHLKPGWTPTHASTFSVTIKGGLPVTLSPAPPPAATPRAPANTATPNTRQ